MRIHKLPVLFACLAGLLTLSHSTRGEEPKLAHRWVYLATNLQVNESVDKAEAIMQRAEAAGYNGIVLADYKLNILDRVPDYYFRNAEKFKQLAAKHHLEIIPCVASIGYSDGLLAHNPNLAEGIPVKDAPLVVHGTTAVVDSETKNLLAGGGFEEQKKLQARGWDFQDAPGKASFLDSDVKHSGKSSLRFENLGANAGPSGNGRVSVKIKLTPWRQYHASVWIKTENFDTASEVQMFPLDSRGRTLSHSHLNVKPTQDWTEHHIVFNSLDDSETGFYIGTWGGKTGKIWFDDAKLEEIAFVNMVRRDACPLVVADAAGHAFTEGKDFAELRDAKLGMVPWAGNFDVYHEPPVLKILPGSRIHDGDKLRASYFHTVTIYDNQVCCCLGDPGVFKILDEQVRSVDKLFAPKTYFLSYDEIRVANWCPACRREGRSAGQLLAENVKKCQELVHAINPSARLCVWSDMFDPAHNAHDNFYLVNGDLAGSWEGLEKDTTVINWNSEKPQKSLPWFAKRGNPQILAGYYDDNPKAISTWLAAGKGVPGIDGVMYTTWQSNFHELEAFAKAAWGGGK